MRITSIIIACLLTLNCAQTQNIFPDVVMETTKGKIVLRLYDNTYQHGENFIKLVNEGFYNNQLFHRVIADFMIQTGDDKSINAQPGELLGTGGKQYTIPAEIFPGYYHKKGALAAARQSDNVNPEKESSGSQFYIVAGRTYSTEELMYFINNNLHSKFTEQEYKDYTTIGGTPHLDNEYTVFGEVIEGLAIIDSISIVPTDRNNRPLEDITILKMYTKERDNNEK